MAERAARVRVRPAARPPALRWYPVWLRNLRTWRHLAVPSLVGNFGEPLLYLVALGYGLGALVGDVGGLPYVTFLAGGIVCSSAMMTASYEAMYSSYTRMAVQRNWDAMISTPLEVRDVVIGEILWAATKSLLSTVAILVVGGAMGAVTGWQSMLALPVAFLLGICFASMAMVVTAVARTYDFFLYYTTLAMTPMMLLGGVFFPLSQMAPAVRAVAEWLPLTGGVAVVRPLVTGGETQGALANLLLVAVYAAAALCLAVHLVRRRLEA